MSPIPRIIHQTWKTTDLPRPLRRLRKGWMARHPGWEQRLWTDEDLRAFVRDEFPDLLAMYDGYREPICRVDLARYLILWRLGGVYADLDCECLKPIEPMLAGATLAIGLEPDSHLTHGWVAERRLPRLLCPSLVASVPGHAFWPHLLAFLRRSSEQQNVLDATGPCVLTAAYDAFPEPATIDLLPAGQVYPVDKMQCREGRLHDLAFWEESTRHAYVVHHWAGTWWSRRAIVDPSFPTWLPFHVIEGDNRVRPPSVAPRSELRPLVSCLMVTARRFEQARLAIRCFQRQTYPNLELVVVDSSPDDALARHVAALDDRRIRHVHSPGDRRSLGALRNLSVGLAAGDLVAIWDDDDLSHPARIATQYEALTRTDAAAAMLRRVVVWWPAMERVVVSMLRLQWENTLLARRDAMEPYPEIDYGEDTPAIDKLRARRRVVLIDLPRLFVYVAHGANQCGPGHFHQHWNNATVRFPTERQAAVIEELGKELPMAAYRRIVAATPGARNSLPAAALADDAWRVQAPAVP
ncbi:MAG: glycosyltransferase [Alphaproteobacteria bacterium]